MADSKPDTLTADALSAVGEVDELLEDFQDCSGTEEPPEYNLRISSDRVTVVLDCPDPLASLNVNVQQILADFANLEIPVYPDAEQLTRILQNIAAPGCHLREAPIIMGQKVIPSQDGRLDWSKDYFSEGWKVDEETGIIDFWEKLEHRSVREDEILVKLMHPVDGESGLNVFGLEIPVTKPSKVKLRCGKGVRTEDAEDGVSYLASVNGRVRLADGTVSVDDVFVIQGNVSLATGNIHHTGAVQIQGDVENGATINAEGDVMIKGMVDPCNINCGGTLTVAGGLVGSDDYQIEVAGDFNARYINEANIIVGGNVNVSNEISHSHIRARGKVLVTKGRIAGGKIQAYKGIQVAEAGASGSSDTTLIAGVDYAHEDQLKSRQAKVKKLEEAKKKIQAALKGIAGKKDSLDPSEKQVLDGLAAKSQQLDQAISDENAAILSSTAENKRHAVLEIAMFEEVWSGTRIHLGEFKTVVKTSIQKPRIAQLRQTRVRILPMGEGNKPLD